MTATPVDSPPAGPPAASTPPTGNPPPPAGNASSAGKAKQPKKPRSWRWLRLVVPPAAVLVVVLLGTWIYQLEQPDQDDPAYLSPTSTADIGAAALADRVRAAGVDIQRVTKSSDALVAAHQGDATLLITTPELVHPYYLRMLKLLPPTTDVVLIEPRLDTVVDALLPLWSAKRAYVSEARDPGCTYAPAAEAGRAGVHRTRYGPVLQREARELARCYDDALVVFERGASRVTLVGSADPFRNDRIGEHDNAKLATGLLTRSPRLIWLDLHRHEPPPLVDNNPGLGGGSAAPPSLRPPSSGEPGDPDFPVRGKDGSDDPQTTWGGDNGEEEEPPNPLWQAFPPWTYVAAALLVIVFVLSALAQARRLGSPVVEPLPIVVRASETVAGRGRLYQRAKARAESLRTLRATALSRLTHLLRLEPDVDRRTLIEGVAAQSGWPAPLVEQVLFGPSPEDDVQLVQAATSLEQLLNAVATEHPVAATNAPDAAPEGESR
ncbi:DUF4350 domain-containing protein [Dactylosporangium roseum]|uniref:DUF4350 domain-containing protein n=1 Tax=Dactylosporangium roseum TaxID=47989 RepID=A0ABY5Z2L7_9ACTN|nr:DUF4350 domain-containing protein [Dactylosporangium roseum]UWZ35851.1 DUF4350 domain-containing protein [Dactylosporangium roseum]